MIFHLIVDLLNISLIRPNFGANITMGVIVVLLMVGVPIYIIEKSFYDNTLIEKRHHCYSDGFKIGAVKQ